MGERFQSHLSREDVLRRIQEIGKESGGTRISKIPLEGDAFHLYCQARRHFGEWKRACQVAEVTKDTRWEVRSELGHKIDWWPLYINYSAREGLAVMLNHLFRENINLTPEALKESPFLDIYTDAMNLFGTYRAGLEYGNVPVFRDEEARRCNERTGLVFPASGDDLAEALAIYTTQDQEERNTLIQMHELHDLGTKSAMDIEVARTVAIVDGMNVAFGEDREPMLSNVDLVDKALQDLGFIQNNISHIFDASFRHRLPLLDAQEYERRIHHWGRYAQAPAGERADLFILTLALSIFKDDPSTPPVIVSNDSYSQYFSTRKELAPLHNYKKGVAFVSAGGKMEAVISRFKDV